jgi:hypothetical protein
MPVSKHLKQEGGGHLIIVLMNIDERTGWKRMCKNCHIVSMHRNVRAGPDDRNTELTAGVLR